MSRSLIRSGLVALIVLALSVPAHALPLTEEHEGFMSSLSLSALWERLVSPIVALWTGGVVGSCTPGGGATSYGGGASTQGAGTCDPNG